MKSKGLIVALFVLVFLQIGNLYGDKRKKLPPIMPEGTQIPKDGFYSGVIKLFKELGFKHSQRPEDVQVLTWKGTDKTGVQKTLRIRFNIRQTLHRLLAYRGAKSVVTTEMDQFVPSLNSDWQYVSTVSIDFARSRDVSTLFTLLVEKKIIDPTEHPEGTSNISSLHGAIHWWKRVNDSILAERFRSPRGNQYTWSHKGRFHRVYKGASYDVNIRLIDSITSEAVYCDIELVGWRSMGNSPHSSRVILRVSSEESLAVLKAAIYDLTTRRIQDANVVMIQLRDGSFWKREVKRYKMRRASSLLKNLKGLLETPAFKSKTMLQSSDLDKNGRLQIRVSDFLAEAFIRYYSDNGDIEKSICEARQSLEGVIDLRGESDIEIEKNEALRLAVKDIIIEFDSRIASPQFRARLMSAFAREVFRGLRKR